MVYGKFSPEKGKELWKDQEKDEKIMQQGRRKSVFIM